MCGKVISGADYEQINSFGGGIFQTDSKFFITNRIAGTQKGRGTDAAAEAVSPPGRISNDSPNGFRTNLLTARRPNGFRTIRSDRFRTVVRTYFGRLPEGVSDCHSEGIPPHRPDQIPDRFPEEFQVVIPDRFQVAGRIPNRHPYEPQLGRTAAPEIAPKSGRHSRRRNVRPQPPYPNKRFSSAANLYPAFSTCASANSYEKMMKSRDSSYESV